MSNSNLQVLLEKIALDDDQQAFKKLITLRNVSLRHLAYSITGDMKEAEEVVADVFIKIWHQRSKLPEIKNIEYYLYMLTKNGSLDYLRKFHKRKRVSLEDIHLSDYHLTITPENQLITAELGKRIDLMINELPPKCRLIFKLVKEDGLKHKEVAELLNIDVKTVESQISIALKKLHNALSIYLPDYVRI